MRLSVFSPSVNAMNFPVRNAKPLFKSTTTGGYAAAITRIFFVQQFPSSVISPSRGSWAAARQRSLSLVMTSGLSF